MFPSKAASAIVLSMCLSCLTLGSIHGFVMYLRESAGWSTTKSHSGSKNQTVEVCVLPVALLFINAVLSNWALHCLPKGYVIRRNSMWYGTACNLAALLVGCVFVAFVLNTRWSILPGTILTVPAVIMSYRAMGEEKKT